MQQKFIQRYIVLELYFLILFLLQTNPKKMWCAEDIIKSQRSKNEMVWTHSKKGSKGGHQSGL